MNKGIAFRPVGDLIQTRNDNSKKTQTRDYQASGTFPIVDQGLELICGYTNDRTKVYEKCLPVIIFGDHTLHTKYVDFPFVVGADGTQILVPRLANCQIKYLYYLIQRATELIGSEGYKRHFKILKEHHTEYIEDDVEQKKIATILSSVDEVIEKTRAQIEKLKDLKTGMMQELLTKGIGHTEFKDSPLGRIPTAWKIKRLSELVPENAPICYGILMPGKSIPGGIPVIKVKDIKDGSISENELLLTSKEIDKKYTRSRVKAGDILLTIRGTTGRTAIVTHSLDGANITQDTARIRISIHELSKYVFVYLQSPQGQSQITYNTIGQAVKGINLEEVRKLMVILPTAEERQVISNIMESFDKKLEYMTKKLKHLTHFKKALMQDLLTGNVRVNVNQEEAATA